MSEEEVDWSKLTEDHIRELSGATLDLHQKTCEVYRKLRRVCEFLKSERDANSDDRYISEDYDRLIEVIEYQVSLVKTNGVFGLMEQFAEANAELAAAGFKTSLAFWWTVSSEVTKLRNTDNAKVIVEEISAEVEVLVILHETCLAFLSQEHFVGFPWAQKLLAQLEAFDPATIFAKPVKRTSRRRHAFHEPGTTKELMPALEKATGISRS